ncbi:MAG: hypothetical protein ACJ8GJ_09900 [Vitreoscilla sp.]
MKPLSPARALLSALFNAETKAYPSHEGRRLEPREIAASIRKTLDATTPALLLDDDLLAKAKESLDEAKGQTEYQDQKVSRLLTIVAFLTAAAGAVFSKVVDSYPIDHSALWVHGNILVYGAYFLFFSFVLLVGAGALVSFHATRTRFVWDSTQGNLVVERDKVPKSHLFFQESVRTTPENWAKSFAAQRSAQLVEAYKGYIVEAYLVNAKIADKLRLLEPAQALLSHAIRVLLIWVFLVVLLFVFVDRSLKHDQTDAAAATSTMQIDARPTVATPQTGTLADARAGNSGQTVVVNCAPAQRPTTLNLPGTKVPPARACTGSASATSEPLSDTERR